MESHLLGSSDVPGLTRMLPPFCHSSHLSAGRGSANCLALAAAPQQHQTPLISHSLTSFMYSLLDDSHPFVQVAECRPVVLRSPRRTAASHSAFFPACPHSGEKPEISMTQRPLTTLQLLHLCLAALRKRQWSKNNEAEKKGITCRNCIASAPNTKLTAHSSSLGACSKPIRTDLDIAWMKASLPGSFQLEQDSWLRESLS